MQGFLTAEQAAERLGIRRETLYAYVSRGQIQSTESADGRSKLYRLTDIEELEQRKEQRRRPAKALREALHFGNPLLESSLTLLQGGQIFYRGQNAVELSRTRTFEQVASWLWLEDFDAAEEIFPSRPRCTPGLAHTLAEGLKRPWAVESLQIYVPILAQADPRAWTSESPSQVARAGAQLLQDLVELASLQTGRAAGPTAREHDLKGPSSIACRLARAWASPSLGDLKNAAPPLLDSALILCADHELNVSSFSARCVASAGSPIHSAVGAGLAALHGFRHGGHTRRIEGLLREAGTPRGVEEAISDRLRRGEPVPGFGQPLYPDGDPRYGEIIARIGELMPNALVLEWAQALESAGRDLLNERPTVDIGLALVAKALGLPRDAALTLFALGRTVGWVGHALEQYQRAQLIRPRARYVGIAPRTAPQT